MPRNDVTYVRIAPVSGSWYYFDDNNRRKFYVRPVFILNDNQTPYWVRGSYLRIDTHDTEYRVYNPQRLPFEIMPFMSVFKMSVSIWNEFVTCFEVVNGGT